MQVKVTIREARIYFESRVSSKNQLAIRLSAGPHISKIDALSLNRFCGRWESEHSIELTLDQTESIQIQILKLKGSLIKKVICQGKIELSCFPHPLAEQLKISLSNNGQVYGWLYCQLSRESEPPQKRHHFLHLHRFTCGFLDMRDQECNVSIYLNNKLIFIREIHLKLRKRTLFPSIKQVVKKSDVLCFQIDSSRQKGRLTTFVIDQLESGQTSLLQAWMRNSFGNKMGDFELEYFLQNFFLPNKRPAFSSNQAEKAKGTRRQQTLTKKEREDLRISINISTLNNIGSAKGERTKNPLLNRVINGERKRRNLVYCPETPMEIKKRTSLNQIVEDMSGSQA